MSKFVKRFRRLHDESGLSQTAAIEMIYRKTGTSIPQTTLSGYLNVSKPSEPTASIAASIAEAYGVSLEWLCGMTDTRDQLSTIEERLSKLNFDDDIIHMANLLMEMPKAERVELVSYVSSKHKQWQVLSRLVGVLKKFDVNGSLTSRVAELSGIEAGRLNAVLDLGDDNGFGDGDLSSTDKQRAFAIG